MLNTKSTITDGKKVEGLPGMVGDVEFRNVDFAYPNTEEPILHNISFTAKKGKLLRLLDQQVAVNQLLST